MYRTTVQNLPRLLVLLAALGAGLPAPLFAQCHCSDCCGSLEATKSNLPACCDAQQSESCCHAEFCTNIKPKSCCAGPSCCAQGPANCECEECGCHQPVTPLAPASTNSPGEFITQHVHSPAVSLAGYLPPIDNAARFVTHWEITRGELSPSGVQKLFGVWII